LGYRTTNRGRATTAGWQHQPCGKSQDGEQVVTLEILVVGQNVVEQVNLHQADAGVCQVALFLAIKFATWTGVLVRWAEDLQDRDDPALRARFDDFQKTLGLLLEKGNLEWVGQGHAGRRDGCRGILWAPVFDDPNIRIVNAILTWQLHQNALLHPGPEVPGKDLVEQALSKRNEVVMHVPQCCSRQVFFVHKMNTPTPGTTPQRATSVQADGIVLSKYRGN
jgi:hypothetical protein